MTEIFGLPEQNSPFIAGTAIQFAWDSTSLGWFLQCPKLYEYQMIQGWFPKGDNPHLTFGLLFHAAIETFDRLRAHGSDYEEALLEAVRYTMKASGSYEEPAHKWVPWQSTHTVKNRETLVRTIIWYAENYKEDPAELVILDNGEPAVELSFRFELAVTAPNGESYIMCGHLDKLVSFSGAKYIQDKKTSGHQLSETFFKGFDLDVQMSLYSTAGQVVLRQPVQGVMIDGVQVTVGFSEFLRGLTFRTEERLAEFLESVEEALKRNESYANVGHWPRNFRSCNHYMDSKGMGGCPFKKVCSRQPSQRQSVLETNFTQRRWNPLEPRTADTSTR